MLQLLIVVAIASAVCTLAQLNAYCVSLSNLLLLYLVTGRLKTVPICQPHVVRRQSVVVLVVAVGVPTPGGRRHTVVRLCGRQLIRRLDLCSRFAIVMQHPPSPRISPLNAVCVLVLALALRVCNHRGIDIACDAAMRWLTMRCAFVAHMLEQTPPPNLATCAAAATNATLSAFHPHRCATYWANAWANPPAILRKANNITKKTIKHKTWTQWQAQ